MSTNLLQQECRLQIACTWHAFKISYLAFLWHTLSVITWFLEQFGVFLKALEIFSKTTNCTGPIQAPAMLLSLKHLVVLINIKMQLKSPYYLNILKSSWSEINDHMYIIINNISTCIVFLMLWGFISQFFSRRPVLLVEYAVVDNLQPSDACHSVHDFSH